MLSYQGRRWAIKNPAPPELARTLACSPALATVLHNRGYTTPEAVADLLITEYPRGVHSHTLLSGIHEAVARIRQALRAGERIAIFGDYDVDGITAAALMYQTLVALGANVEVIIPHRTRDGYGLSNAVPQRLLDAEVSLLITVDCGISNAPQVADLLSCGIDVIVTDHHTPPDELPGCICINPKLPDDLYPFKGLVGCAVAFKLAAALEAPLRGRDLLDLVGLATVADMGELVGENRVLVKAGLQALHITRRPGIVALCDVAGIARHELTATDIGFGLGPRLNAAGRIEHAELAYRLLLTQDPSEAATLAQQLNALNRERQELTELQTQEAIAQVEREGCQEHQVIVIVGDYNPGVVGLIAGNVSRQFYRPAIVLHPRGDGTASGSARSVAEVNIVELLRAAHRLLIKYGGHAAAAGMSVRIEDIEALAMTVNHAATQVRYEPSLAVDAAISLDEVTWALFEELQLLEPYGHGNPRPLFVCHDVTFALVKPMGKANTHLSCTVAQGPHSFRAVWWRMGEAARDLAMRQGSVVFAIDRNEWQGRTELQLNIKDVRV